MPGEGLKMGKWAFKDGIGNDDSFLSFGQQLSFVVPDVRTSDEQTQVSFV